MLCDNCGHENPPSLQFCEDCGSKIEISQIQKNIEIQEITQIREIPQRHEQTKSEDKEIAIYSDDKGVRITNKRAIIENKTYDLTNVLSISLHEEEPNKSYSVTIIVSITVFFVILIFFKQWWWFGIILIIGSVLDYVFVRKKKYSIRLFHSSGETDIFSTPNKEYIRNIVNIMNEAIKRRD